MKFCIKRGIHLLGHVSVSCKRALVYLRSMARRDNEKTTKWWLVFWLLCLTTSFIGTTKSIFTFKPLEKDLYSIAAKGISENNPQSAYSDNGGGMFKIHPGSNEAVQLDFKSKRWRFLKLYLSGGNDSQINSTLLNIKKNRKEIGDLEFQGKEKSNKIYLMVTPVDTLKISIEKRVEDQQAGVDIKIKGVVAHEIIVSGLILMLWLGFFYFMYKKNQASIVLAHYAIFLLTLIADLITFGGISVNSLLAYSTFFMVIALLSAVLYQEVYRIRANVAFAAILSIMIIVLIYIVPAAFITYYISFKVAVDHYALFAVFQSNTMEGVEFVGESISLFALLFLIGTVSFFSFLFWWHRRSKIVFVDRSILGTILILTLIVLILSVYEARLPKFIYENWQVYSSEMDALSSLIEKRTVDRSAIVANKEETGGTYVVVIGESLNKKHMQIYGYPRKTTPKLHDLLKSNQLLKFDRAYSNHTHTMPVLSLALTEAAQDKQKDYINSISIVELCNRAGFETVWLTNQVLLGKDDNLVSIIAQTSNKLVGINKTIGRSTFAQAFDGELLKHFERILDEQTKKNRIIFVHLMGSHAKYCSRFPSEYDYFNSSYQIGEFGSILPSFTSGRRAGIGCYDNTVLYNDYVVNELISILKSKSENSSLIYFSDHADDLFGGSAHNATKFTYAMTQVPMIVWMSDRFKSVNDAIAENLKSNTNALFPNDRLYDTLVGWANIKTPHYREEYDLASKSYNIDETQAVTLHGRKRYASEDNTIYWQEKNASILLQKKLDEKFVPDQVNTTGKLLDIWQVGLRAFEIDLIFNFKNDGLLYVGQDDGKIGFDLESFLETVDSALIKKILFDLKNLNSDNYKEALSELNRLDEKFELKSKVILESGWTSETFKVFRDNGWHTSYYLPTKIFAIKDPRELKKLAKKISTQVIKQNTQAVSFDLRLHTFAKEFLEPLLPPEMNYHVWFGPALRDIQFSEKINNSIYNDKRIKTVLVPFSSDFYL